MRPIKSPSSNSNGNSSTASSFFSYNENSEVRMTETPRGTGLFAPRRQHAARNASFQCYGRLVRSFLNYDKDHVLPREITQYQVHYWKGRHDTDWRSRLKRSFQEDYTGLSHDSTAIIGRRELTPSRSSPSSGLFLRKSFSAKFYGVSRSDRISVVRLALPRRSSHF